MRAYQIDLKSIESFYNTSFDCGLINRDLDEKNVPKDYRSFLFGVLKTIRSKLSATFLVSVVAFFVAGLFSYLNGLWSLLGITVFALLMVALVYVAECVILYGYERSYFSRIDSKHELVSVLRDGQRVDIPASQLLIGDILFLETGVVLRCDARVFESEHLYADEQFVFGATVPSLKRCDSIDGNNITAENQSNMLWKGSSISSGYGRAVVTALDDECYLSKTGGRKEKRQHSVYFAKQSNISRIVTYVYLILVLFVLLISVLFSDSKIESFLLTAVLSSLVIINPMAYITECSYYRMAKKLSGEGVYIRNVDAFDGMSGEKQIYFETDDLTENRLKYVDTINFAADSKSALSYFSLCVGDDALNKAIECSLCEWDLNYEQLNRKYPVFRRERDEVGNRYSLFSKNGSSVVVSVGHWMQMLPLLGGESEQLTKQIAELEQQGKFVCALASTAMDFIPSKLDVSAFAGEMSLIALVVFDVMVDEATKEIISRFKKVGLSVYLRGTGYSDSFVLQLASAYGMDYSADLTADACGFSVPQYSKDGPVVYESALQSVKEQASVVLKDEMKVQPIIYRVKCMFCGLRRFLNFLSIIGVATVGVATAHLLLNFDLSKLLFPLALLPIYFLLPAYYLMETTRNCVQFNRSYFLAAFCAFSAIVTVCMGCESSILSLCLSFVLLSLYLMVSVRQYRKFTRTDVLFLGLILVLILLPWIIMGTNDWSVSLVLALFPAVGAYLLDLLY